MFRILFMITMLFVGGMQTEISLSSDEQCEEVCIPGPKPTPPIIIEPSCDPIKNPGICVPPCSSGPC